MEREGTSIIENIIENVCITREHVMTHIAITVFLLTVLLREYLDMSPHEYLDISLYEYVDMYLCPDDDIITEYV